MNGPRVSDRSRARDGIAKVVVELGDKYCAFKVQKGDIKTLNAGIHHAVYALWRSFV